MLKIVNEKINLYKKGEKGFYANLSCKDKETNKWRAIPIDVVFCKDSTNLNVDELEFENKYYYVYFEESYLSIDKNKHLVLFIKKVSKIERKEIK